MTVQTLEDTPAALALGKLCEEHDSSYEWPAGKSHFGPKLGRTFHVRFVESIPAQANNGCAVDRHSQRAAWCPGRLVSALMLLDTQQVLESRQMAS